MRLIVILLLFVMLSGAILAQETDSLHQYLIVGSKAYNANDFAASRAAYLNALRLQPTNVEAIHNLGLIANTLGDLQTAMTYYQEALRYDSTDPDIYNNIGAVMSARGQTSQAISYFEKALRLDTANYQIRVNLAGEYIKSGRFADAARQVRGVVAVDTSLSGPPYLLGRAMLGLRKSDSALLYFNMSVLRGGSMTELYHFKAAAEMNLGKFDDAGKSLSAVLLKEPNNKEACHSLGIVRVKQSRYEDALKLFKRSVELDSSYVTGWVSLGAMYMVTGQAPQADSIYRKLSAVDTTLGYRMVDLYNLEKSKQTNKAGSEKKPGKK